MILKNELAIYLVKALDCWVNDRTSVSLTDLHDLIFMKKIKTLHPTLINLHGLASSLRRDLTWVNDLTTNPIKSYRVAPCSIHGWFDKQLDLARPQGYGRIDLISRVNLNFQTESSPFHCYYYAHHYITIIVATIPPLPPLSSILPLLSPLSPLSSSPYYLCHHHYFKVERDKIKQVIHFIYL